MSVIIGTMRWGQWGEKLTIKQQAQLIEKSVENGFTMFDTADIYGDYSTEQELGEAFFQSSVDRSSIQLISKCGICYPSDIKGYKTKAYDTSSKHIKEAVDNSLQNLQTDYLDYMLIHRPNPLMDFNEIAETILQLEEIGKVIKFGVSNFSHTEIDYLKKYIEIETHQIEYSLTQPKALFDHTLQQAQVEHFPVMAWSPVGNYYSPQTSEALKISVTAFAQKYNCSENMILLAWVKNYPSEIIPVVGTSKAERIQELTNLKDIHLENEEWFLLLEKSRNQRVD